jgi:elongation factor Ts
MSLKNFRTLRIKTLRNRTQASYAECKAALDEAEQSIEKAERILITKGLKIIDSLLVGKTDAGIINAYVHTGNKIGVLVETNCNTDFVARTEEFQDFVKNIALQVASMRPRFVSKNDIPDEELMIEYEKRIARLEEVKSQGNLDELAEAEMVQWFSEVCLLEQTYVKDSSKTVKELLAELINKVGEYCEIKGFVRWEVGGDYIETRKLSPSKKVKFEENLEEEKHEYIKNKFQKSIFLFLGVMFFILNMFFLYWLR